MKKLTKAETIMCAAAMISTSKEPEDVLIRDPNDCPKCGFGLSDEWPDGRRVCDDCDHEWFKAPDPVRVYPSPCNR
jgi:predicted Zn-ribbon and HTH transcriptional regulator